MKLTDRQREILHLIENAIQATGIPPTRAEIAEELGFRSANAAEDHLKALARKGYIELTAGTSRGIRVLLPTQASEQVVQNTNQQLILPLVGQVAAGAPILATEHIETHLTLTTDAFAQIPDYLLKVKGMSMKNIGILDGDLLAVKKKNTAHNGEIIVARIDDEVTVKRIMMQKKHIELHPENEDFRPIIVTEHEDFSIEGLAVGLIRSQFR